MIPAALDPRGPAAEADPSSVWRALRDDHPIGELEIGGRPGWLVSRHADVAFLLGHRAGRQRPMEGGVPDVLGDGPAARMFASSMSQADPPQHARLRRTSARAFSPTAVAAMRRSVDDIVVRTIAGLEDDVDVVSELSHSVPMAVICELLGIADDQWADILRWTPDALRVFMPSASNAAELARCDQACAFFFDFLGGMIEARRRHPGDDLISSIVAASDSAGGELSDDELVGVLRGLITAGFETTASTISGFMLAMTQHPAALAVLRTDADARRRAVEESLRWESPVRAQPRYVHESVEVAGALLEPGSYCWLLLGAANHDERAFGSDTDAFDVGRDASEHVTFGGGRHVCLGSGLARAELESVIAHVAAAFSAVELSTPPQRRHHLQFSSISELNIHLVRQ